MVLNIASWSAGFNPWGTQTGDEFAAPSYSDGMVEVVGLTGVMHIGQIVSRMKSGIRLAQGSSIDIKLKSSLPVQIDGEPWLQTAGQIILRPALLQASMLRKHKTRVAPSSPRPQSRRQATIETSKPPGSVKHSIFHVPLSP